MRKVIFLICILALVAVPVFAQDSSQATPPATEEAISDTGSAAATPEATEGATKWQCPDGFQGQTLSVFNWTTYVADNTISDFERLCGVKVTYDTYTSNEDLLARLKGGNPGYDVIVPSDHMVATMIQLGIVQPLDLDKIPNFANVSESLKNPVYDPGNKYSVPYQWGTVVIGYNKAKVGHDVTSWNDLFNYTGGKVAWLDDERAMLGIALTMLGDDANSTDETQIDAARDFLIAHGSNVAAIASDDGQAMLERGDVDMTVEYSGDIYQIMSNCNCQDYGFVIPKEGTNLWIDNLAIPTGAPNKPLADAFIDYILDPQVGADISNYTAYASPNQAAIDQKLIDPELLSNEAIYPPADVRDHWFTILPNTDQETIYNDAWDAIKASLGTS
ncbi:MAG TPA: spermidine/putrescine ABC transporter substrate-binding protein [Phototrophicaceae bacterium]|nr:spermidine/putrescine ABC transporter substrate-binding protein [Phototrophicaceae bacterium]